MASNAELNRVFGRVLQKRRDSAGMTQMELAEAADLTNQYISALERGLNSPSLTALFGIAQALGTTVSSLIQEVESKLH